jgi:hypothetical protein
MKSTKHLSRLTAVEQSAVLKIDFGGEEVTNLGSSQETVAAVTRVQTSSEDNVNLCEGTDPRQIVRVDLSSSDFIYCSDIRSFN